MNLRPLALGALVLAASLAASQDMKTGLSGSAPAKAASSRMEAISLAVQGRLGLQKDYLFDEGDYPRIIQILRWECDYLPDNYERWTDLIWMYGNIEAREDELAAAVEFRLLNPNNPEAWYPEAQVHYFRRNWIKVIPLLETSISIGTPHPNSYRLLAQAWTRLGFTPQAIRVWERMLKVYPDDERARVQLERAKGQLGSPQ